jgi:hypothetical protein
MSKLRTVNVPDTVERAASALSNAFGGTVTLENIRPLSSDNRRNFIARCDAIDGDGRRRSVIVKATRSPTYDPADADVLRTSGLAREWVAAACIGAHAPARGHGGALLAGERLQGILVFEDLGAGLGSLVDPLLGRSAQAAEQALTAYAIALARLHSDMVDCGDLYHEIFQSIFGAGRPRRPPGWRVEKDAELVVSRIGGTPSASELESLSARLSDPGPWLSLVHGDPCPDNSLLLDGEVRLLDYEFARPSHALLDGIYWRIGFPTCWCAGRVPAEVAARVDAVYRAEIGKAMPLALDDKAYRAEAANISAVWLLSCLSWRLDEGLTSDETWGTWSIRGRLLWYLDSVIETTSSADVLPHLNETARTWRAELRSRWPDATPLGLYPPFVPDI